MMDKIVLHLDNGTTIDVPRKSIISFVMRDHDLGYSYTGGVTKRTNFVYNTWLFIDKHKVAASEIVAKDIIEQIVARNIFKYEVHLGGKQVETYVPAGIPVNGSSTGVKKIVEDEGDAILLKLVN